MRRALSLTEVDDLDNRFTYHPPTPAKVGAHEAVRAGGRALAQLILETVPPGRERDLAVERLEEATFWANAGVARTLDVSGGGA